MKINWFRRKAQKLVFKKLWKLIQDTFDGKREEVIKAIEELSKKKNEPGARLRAGVFDSAKTWALVTMMAAFLGMTTQDVMANPHATVTKFYKDAEGYMVKETLEIGKKPAIEKLRPKHPIDDVGPERLFGEGVFEAIGSTSTWSSVAAEAIYLSSTDSLTKKITYNDVVSAMNSYLKGIVKSAPDLKTMKFLNETLRHSRVRKSMSKGMRYVVEYQNLMMDIIPGDDEESRTQRWAYMHNFKKGKW